MALGNIGIGSSMWYYAVRGKQCGPVSEDELKELLASGRLPSDSLVWKPEMPDWQPAARVPELADCLAQRPGTLPPPLPDPSIESQRITAGVFALLLGSLGVHKFYLGMPVPGLILLLTTLCTCFIGAAVTHVIALVEGIIYLSKTNADFYRTYVVEKRSWF